MMDNDYYEPSELDQSYSLVEPTETLPTYTAKTFFLMFLGLLVTFGVAFFLSNTLYGLVAVYYAATYVPYIHVILLVAELIVAVAMTAMVQKISVGVARLFFFLYSLLTGMSFAVIFLAYDLTTLVLAFGMTALYFGVMAAIGYFAHVDLSRIRNLLLGALIFLIVGNLLMMFIPGLQVMDQVLCSIGVVVFTLYTAYDTQKLKAYYEAYAADGVLLKKASIYAALNLYLDFINMFLYILRLLSRRRK